MLEIIVHVTAIAAVIGYVEYRLRSYAALMHRFDQLEQAHIHTADELTSNVLTSNNTTSSLLVNKVDRKLDKLEDRIEGRLAQHEEHVLEAERTGISSVRDAVATSLRTFSESVWRGVHNMAQSVQLPSSPLFICYYCHQKFPVTQRERIGENDYCPEHGYKRQPVAETMTIRVPVRATVVDDSPAPWESQ